ncbi:MAG: ATP-binding cassette domain-containing protein, partial [Opitutae bacterium]|nr:ATP-binding cassette domain-containing protein [Opitutae bacterium]
IAILVLRFYDVGEGAIQLNGTDVRDVDLQQLRSHIGSVPQEPFLFDTSIAENLRFGKHDSTVEDLIDALKFARAWEFVDRLPQGIETLIGERGVRLSMGEKQRLTIARVFLRNPPLLILDEATSSVDSITEHQIQTALEKLFQNRTTLIIAHRLSTVRQADNIVVLDKGRILEQGTHQKLLDRNGSYAQLWHHQLNVIPDSSDQFSSR